MANTKPVLYVGITNNICRRSIEHKLKFHEGFSKTYNLNKLVYFEEYFDIKEAIAREKQLKHWNRNWKIELKRKINPKFEDLSEKLLFGGGKINADPRSGRG